MILILKIYVECGNKFKSQAKLKKNSKPHVTISLFYFLFLVV